VGYSDIALASPEIPAALSQQITKMHEAAQVCTKLVANLLSLAHLGDESAKTVDLVRGARRGAGEPRGLSAGQQRRGQPRLPGRAGAGLGGAGAAAASGVAPDQQRL
jgi:hypothetical protein